MFVVCIDECEWGNNPDLGLFQLHHDVDIFKLDLREGVGVAVLEEKSILVVVSICLQHYDKVVDFVILGNFIGGVNRSDSRII
jgi:hypothetical protein